MSQALHKLAASAASGTLREIVEAIREAGLLAWVGEEGGWRDVDGELAEHLEDGATVIESGGHRIAMRGDVELAGPLLGLAAPLVRAGLARLAALDAKSAAESRLDLNERIAGLGSYDWNILEDTNKWSDELFRIYGHQPGDFNASYEKFLSLVLPEDRDRIRQVHEAAYGSGEPYEMEERIIRPDGTVRTLWSYGAVIHDEEGRPVRMVGVCRDITEAREAEQQAELHRDRIRKSELLRQQALELNDNVVQGLAAAVWAIDGGTPQVARNVATETLDHARAMMHELLTASDAPTGPGSLVRASAARLTVDAPPPTSSAERGADRCRVVLADDSEDLRMLLRVRLEFEGPIDVVGEAADGIEALEEVVRTRPDVVLLDLSMPRMDGLEACARIREAHPDIRIVILSGWGEATMGSQAESAGADAYVQKGASIAEVVGAVLDTRAGANA